MSMSFSSVDGEEGVDDGVVEDVDGGAEGVETVKETGEGCASFEAAEEAAGAGSSFFFFLKKEVNPERSMLSSSSFPCGSPIGANEFEGVYKFN